MLFVDLHNTRTNTSSLEIVIQVLDEILKNNYNPVVVINIFNTLTKFDGSTDSLSDKLFKKLIKLIYHKDPQNLIFIVDQSCQFKECINGILNKLDLLDDNMIHQYNIIYSDDHMYCQSVNSYIESANLFLKGKSFFIYIDNDEERLINMKHIITDDRISYILFRQVPQTYSFRNLFGLLSDYNIVESYKIEDLECTV